MRGLTAERGIEKERRMKRGREEGTREKFPEGVACPPSQTAYHSFKLGTEHTKCCRAPHISNIKGLGQYNPTEIFIILEMQSMGDLNMTKTQ